MYWYIIHTLVSVHNVLFLNVFMTLSHLNFFACTLRCVVNLSNVSISLNSVVQTILKTDGQTGN